MEISKVGDLLPYRKSLQELWEREEFQPVLAYLSRVRQEAYEAMCALNLLDSDEVIAAKTRIQVTQLKSFNSVLQLPQVLKEIEDRNERVASKLEQYQASQERGEL